MGKDDVLIAGAYRIGPSPVDCRLWEALNDDAAEQAKIMRDSGADLIMLEMMTDIPRMLAVPDSAQKDRLPVWVGLSCAPDTDGIALFSDLPAILTN